MTVLVLNHEYPPVGGGSGRATFNIVKNLLAKGHKVILLTCSYSGYDIEHTEGLKIYTVYGSRKDFLENNHYITFPAYIFLGFLKGLKIIKKEKVDVIHCFMGVPAGLTGVLLKKVTGIPVLISLRGSDVPYWDNSTIMIKLRKVIKWVWSNADRVVALSKGHRNAAEKTLEGAVEKFGVVYNGVAEDFFVEKCGVKEEKLTIITVARLVELKGIQDVLKALAELKSDGRLQNFQYRIIGDGPYGEILRKLAEDLGLAENVFFAGYMDKFEVQREYSMADIFILTSHAEAFGQVFLEAMAAGLPVIGSRVGGIPEIITDSSGVLTNAGNVDDIAESIYSMVENINRYTAENVLKRASDFRWDNISEQYEDEYRNVLRIK